MRFEKLPTTRPEKTPTNRPQKSQAAEVKKTSTAKSGYRSDDPLLRPRDAAAETGRALSTFWRDLRRGLLPKPIYVTPRSPRWRLSELRASVDACRKE